MSLQGYSPVSNCLPVFRILWYPGDIIILILGLGEGDNISHHSQEVAQGISAYKWWKFRALFNILVDLKLVRIKLIFVLGQKSDLVSCLKSCCSYHKSQWFTSNDVITRVSWCETPCNRKSNRAIKAGIAKAWRQVTEKVAEIGKGSRGGDGDGEGRRESWQMMAIEGKV